MALSLVRQSNAQVYREMHLTAKRHPHANPEAVIRLLTVLPGSKHEPIICRLRQGHLFDDDLPAYEALSYVWYQEPPDNNITININSFKTSGSVHRALICLRRSTKPRTLWIDAICINQSNLEERATQVSLMQRIYAQAESVLIWLGARVPFGLGRTLECATVLPRKDSPGSQFQATDVHYGSVKAVIDLLRRPWWTRVWAVQELVVARKAFIICGRHKLGWDDFCHLVHCVASHRSFQWHSQGAHLEEFFALEAYSRDHFSIHDPTGLLGCQSTSKDYVTRSKFDVLSLVFDFRPRNATDPRDKIFVLQGLTYGPIPRNPECAQQWDVPLPKSHEREGYVPSWCPALISPTAIKEGLQRRPLWTGLPGDDYLGPFTATANIPLQDEIVADSFYEGIESKLPITILSGLQCSVTSLGPVYNPSLSSLKHDMLQAMQRREPNAHSFLDSSLRKDAVFDAWEQLSQEAYLQRFSVESALSHKVRIENNELFNLTLHGGKTHLGMTDEN
ncbi:putative Heterokaryon incompatibility domain-containing protein [Seiridium cardinale]